MSNILNLYNIELKRIYKLYLVLLGILLGGNIFIVTEALNTTVKIVALENKTNATIGLLKSEKSRNILFEEIIPYIQQSTSTLLGIAVIFCLLYALVIWYRDFLGKSKTGYTLFMLPNNKFNIYIAKAITVVVMIYGATVMQILLWALEINLISYLSNINSYEIIELFTDGSARAFSELRLIQLYPIDFIMINVIGVILAVVVMFTGVMIQKSFNKVGIVLGGLYIIASIIIYFTIHTPYSDQLLTAHIIYYIVLFTISIGLSYNLLNKKVYV